MWLLNPFALSSDSEPLPKRLGRRLTPWQKFSRKFWPKMINAFRVISGDSFFTVRGPEPLVLDPDHIAHRLEAGVEAEERRPFYLTTFTPYENDEADENENVQVGLADYATLFILRLLLQGARFLLSKTNHPGAFGQNMFAEACRILLYGLGAGTFYFISAIQFGISCLLSVLSMPFVAIAHAYSRGKLFKDFTWSFNPIAQFSDRDESLIKRAERNSILQKIVDAFHAFMGNGVLSIKADFSESFPLRFKIPEGRSFFTSAQIGLADYITLFIPRLVIYGLVKLAEYCGNNMVRAPTIFQTAMYQAGLGVSCIFLAIFIGIQFLISAVLTLLSLPFIAIIHRITSSNGETAKQHFREHFQTETKPNTTCTDLAVIKHVHKDDRYSAEPLSYVSHPNGLHPDYSGPPPTSPYQKLESLLQTKQILLTSTGLNQGQYRFYFRNTFADHIAFLAFCHLNTGNIVIKDPNIKRDIDVSRIFVALCSLIQAYRSADKSEDKTITRLSDELLIEVAAHTCNERALSMDEKRSILSKLKFQYASGPKIEEVTDEEDALSLFDSLDEDSYNEMLEEEELDPWRLH